MAGDEGDFWRDVADAKRELRAELGVNCPRCPVVQPKRIPTRLMPAQKCKVCGYRDPRRHQ